MVTAQSKALPIVTTDRISSLDTLRGFAIMGILIMNIQSFSMISAAYLNPTVWGDFTGINRLVWIASHILADAKFVSLFSMLFGAGILLFSQRLEAKGRSSKGLHYRRIFWLLIIGHIHAYFFWYGDILVAYAACGIMIYLFRNRSPRTLIILGFVSMLFPTLFNIGTALSIEHIPANNMEGMLAWWQPSADAITKELAAYRGNFLEQIPFRAEEAVGLQTFVFVFSTGWHCGGLMLLGMSLFKLGILSAERSLAFYRRMLVIGFAVGLPLIGWGVYHNMSSGWTLAGSMYLGSQFNYWGSVFMASGYLAMIMLICKTGVLANLAKRFAAAGRMAFTNYLGQTLICSLIFYGHGLGLFCQVERWQQILIVLGIWALQLWLSPLWLQKFRFGPAEWLWRSLTYWRLQPLRHKQLNRPISE